MNSSFGRVIEAARSIDTAPVTVTGAEDPHVLQALIEAAHER